MTPLDIPPPFDMLWFKFLIGWLLGAAFGSFGTMLAYRLPRHMSIVSPRSHCPTCQSTLGPKDLVPIFSWVFSRGRCQHCKAPIGARYVAIELATAFAYAFASIWIGISPLLCLAYIAILAAVVIVSLKINK